MTTMMPTALYEHIAAGESQTLEFNASFDKVSTVSLVALANARGSAVLACLAALQKLNNAIQKCGSGFIRIRKALKEYPEIDFEIKEFTGGVTVTFAQKPPALSLGGLSGGVNPELDQLLELIQSQPGLRVTELVSQTGRPARTIERWFKHLKDSQHIEFRGAPKTEGYYPKDLGTT